MDNLFESAEFNKSLTLNERRYMKRWNNEVLPLVMEFQHQLNEAEMTRDQVIDMFNRVEQNLSGKLSNRTAIGKAVDAIKLPSKVLDKIGELAQKSKVVKAYDRLFEQIKAGLRRKLGETSAIISVVDGMGNFARKHPVAQGFVIGILSLASAVAVGPMAVPVVGALLRFGNEILKGEKFSTSVGRAVKTAILGTMVGWGIKELGDMFSNIDVKFENVPGYDAVYKWKSSYSFLQNGEQQLVWSADAYVPDSLRPKIEKLYRLAADYANEGQIGKANAAFSKLKDTIDGPEWDKMIKAVMSDNQKLYDVAVQKAENTKAVIDKVVASAQAITSSAIAGSTGGKKEEVTEADEDKTYKVEVIGIDGTKEMVELTANSDRDALRKAISQSQHKDGVTASIVTDTAAPLNEADGFMTGLAGWIKNVNNKVTTKKLISAWRKAGSPTDSEEIADVLGNLGIDRTVVDDYITSVNPTSGKPKKTKTTSPEVKFNTGNTEFDEKLVVMLKEKGKDAVVKALKAYKTKLSGTDKKVTGPDPYAEFKSQLRKLAGVPPRKRLPADAALKFSNEFEGDIKKMAVGDIESGLYAGDKLLKFAKMGYDVSNEMTKWLGLAGRPIKESEFEEGFLNADEYRHFSSILKNHGFDWKDIGLTVRLDPHVKEGVFVSGMTI